MRPLALLALGMILGTAMVPLIPADAAGATNSVSAKKSKLRAKAAAKTKKPPRIPVVLRNRVLLDGRMVRLGDLFQNTPKEKAEIPVAYTPEPGRRAVFDARWLYRVAYANGLKWRPLSRKEQAVVERRSRIFGRREIEDLVMDTLRQRGLDDNEIVELSNRIVRIHLPADDSAQVDVEDIYHDARTGRITAFLVAQGNEPNAKRIRITGTIFRTTMVPVVKRHILPGETIRRSDIDFLRMKSVGVKRDTVLDLAGLVGMTPIRGLRSGASARIGEVRRPLVVDKGGMVTIIHRIGQMMLTAQGKALDAGSTGDTIRVRNRRSKSIIDARIVGPGQVAVGPKRLAALN